MLGYPAPRRATTRDGRLVTIRPIDRPDAAALVAFHATLSARTTYLRYFYPKLRLSRRDVDYLTDVDGVHRMALVAVDDAGQIVAVARYMLPLTGGDRAEIAIVVCDAWQRRGLSTLLFAVLLDAASHYGIAELGAEVLSGNVGMLRAMASYGVPYTATCRGRVTEIRIRVRPRELAPA